MTVKTYKVWETIIRFIICGVVAASVILGNWVPLLVSILAAMAIFIVMRLRVKGIVEDERTNVVTHKATYFSYSLGTFIMGLAGMILVFTNRDDMTSTPAAVGFVLFFTSFAFSLIKDIAYFVLSRRYGGKME